MIALVTAVQVGIRGWAAAGGWFYWDDFWWHDIVARTPLPDAAVLSLGGHFSPLTYVPYWLLTASAPYDWGARVVVMLLLLLAVNAGVLAVAGRLWRSAAPQVVVYVLWCFSTLAAPSWLWYSQFAMIGTLLLLGTWTLWAYLRALQSQDRGPSVLAVVMLVTGLLAQERMVASAIVMALFLWLVVRPGFPTFRFERRPMLWAASSVVLAGYVLLYSWVVPEGLGGAAPGLGVSGRLATDMVRTSALPALLGGPWVLDDEPVLGRAGTPGWLQFLAAAVLVALVVWSMQLNRAAWRAWLVLALAVALDTGLVVLGRGATLGQASVGEWRYYSDLAVLAPLLITSAFVPPGKAPRHGGLTRTAAKVAVAVFVVSAMVTTIPLGVRWHQSLARPPFETAVAQFRSDPSAVIMDRVLPETMVNPVLGQQRLASRVFSIWRPRVVFDQPTSSPRWLDDSGRLVPGDVVPSRTALPAWPCAFAIDGTTSTSVPLPGRWDYDWGVRIDYTVDRPTKLAVQGGNETAVVDVGVGPGRIYVPIPAVTSGVTVFALDPDVRGCITEVVSGRAGPAATAR
ncbi:MAG TPA: hypothetical protein PLT68_06890 [Actinomycetota bacterium]|nr:hypothetical protein [Actinomycetota bacterium]